MKHQTSIEKRENRISMCRMIYQTITKLSKLRSSQLFFEPVDTNLYKDYLDLVVRPMNLKKVIEKFQSGQYQFSSEIHDDLLLISKNCFVYHQNKSNVEEIKRIMGRYTMSLQNAWNNLTRKLKEYGIDYYLTLGCKEEIGEVIKQMEQKKNKILIKRLQKFDAYPRFIETEENRIGDDSKKKSKGNELFEFDKEIVVKGDEIKEKEKQGIIMSGQSYKKMRYQLKVQSAVCKKAILEQISWNDRVLQNQANLKPQSPNLEYQKQQKNQQKFILPVNAEENKQGITAIPQNSLHSFGRCSQAVSIVNNQQILVQNEEISQSSSSLTSKPVQVQHTKVQPKDRQRQNPSSSEQLQGPVVFIDRQDQQTVFLKQRIRQSNYERLRQEIKRQEQSQQQKSETETEQYETEVERDRGKLFSASIYQLVKNLKWIGKCIVYHEPKSTCNIHNQNEIDQNQEEKKENQQQMQKCEQCAEFKKEQNINNKLKSLYAFQYLKKKLQDQLCFISKGDLNLKGLLQFLSQFVLFIDVVGQAFLNWRISEKFPMVLVGIFSSLEAIIEVKDLGEQFKEILDKNKAICNILEHNQGDKPRDQRRKTRSKKKEAGKCFKINPLRKSYLRYKSTLRVYRYLSEKNEEEAQFSEALQKDDALKYLQAKQSGVKATFLEKIKWKANENQYENVQLGEKKSDHKKTERKKGGNRRPQKSRKQEQIQRQVSQVLAIEQIEESEQFLEQYGLRSNALVIQKYHNKLKFNWQSVYEQAIGPIPNLISFGDGMAQQ